MRSLAQGEPLLKLVARSLVRRRLYIGLIKDPPIAQSRNVERGLSLSLTPNERYFSLPVHLYINCIYTVALSAVNYPMRVNQR